MISTLFTYLGLHDIYEARIRVKFNHNHKLIATLTTMITTTMATYCFVTSVFFQLHTV